MLRSWFLTRGAEFCLLLAFLIHDRLQFSESTAGTLGAIGEAVVLFPLYATAAYIFLLYGPISYLPYLLNRSDVRGKALALLAFALTPAWPVVPLLLTGHWDVQFLMSREGRDFLYILGIAIVINVLVPLLVLRWSSKLPGSSGVSDL